MTLKKLLIILIFLSHASIAQMDSLSQSIDTVSITVSYKLDSIEGSFNKQLDSLKQSYSQTKNKISLIKGRYQQKIDSLHNLKLPTENYTRKLDSLENELLQVQQKAITKIDSLKKRVTDKVKSLNLPPEAEGKISQLTSSIDRVNLPSIDAEIANKMGLGNLKTSLPLPAAEIKGVELPAVSSLPTENIGLPSVNTGIKVQADMDDLTKVTGKAGGIQQQLQEATSSTDKLAGAVEEKATEQVKDMQGQVVPTDTGLPVEVPATSEEAKEQLMTLAKNEAMNHFAGKEAVLQHAMDKMTKYKKKYADVESMKDLPRHAPNPLKGKPFIERFVPGITFQFQNYKEVMLDVNLSAGYKFTQHIIAGLGWNQRWAYTMDSHEFNSSSRIFGARSYGEFHFKKGFALRAEIECMNTMVMQGINPTTETYHREWVWSAFTGAKQEYRISKNIRGNFQVLYNLFDPHNKSPYIDRLNMRMGFEFVLKKKRKVVVE